MIETSSFTKTWCIFRWLLSYVHIPCCFPVIPIHTRPFNWHFMSHLQWIVKSHGDKRKLFMWWEMSYLCKKKLINDIEKNILPISWNICTLYMQNIFHCPFGVCHAGDSLLVLQPKNCVQFSWYWNTSIFFTMITHSMHLMEISKCEKKMQFNHIFI